MRQSLYRIISTIVIVLMLGASARANQSASTQPQAASSPSQAGENAAAQKPSAKAASTAAPKKEEAQKLNPIVVTATKIEQPISEIGTTITVDQDSHVLHQVPGVQVTQTGSPGTETDVSIRGASASQTLVLLDGVEVNTGA